MGILRDVLNDVAACGLSASMKGRLCHWAIEMAFRYAGGAVEATVLTCYEETLEAARQASGQAFSTSKLQAELRARGRADLAKRVCKQAKARQGTAHPDVGLAKDVTEALSTSEEASSTLPGSGGGSSEGDGASRPESVQVSQTDRHDGEANPPCIPQSHAGRFAHADSGDVRARIVSIYTQHNPAMLASGEVDKLLARFHGQEDVLYRKVLSKYIPGNLQTATDLHADSMGNEVAQPPAATSRLVDAPHAVSNGDAVVCSGLTETMMAVQPKQPGKMQEDTYNGPEAIQEESRTVPADYDDEALGSDVAPDDDDRNGASQACCDNRTWRAELALWDSTPAHQLRRALAGARSRHINFIRDQTGAKIELCGLPLRLIVSADRDDIFNRAVAMAQDLIDNTRAAFDRRITEGGVAFGRPALVQGRCQRQLGHGHVPGHGPDGAAEEAFARRRERRT